MAGLDASPCDAEVALGACVWALSHQPVCKPNTQTNQMAVAYMGTAMTCRKVFIHAPGLGKNFSQDELIETNKKGKAMPKPMAPKMGRACQAGKPMAKPKEAPMNGAVQGDAMTTANTPDHKELVAGLAN